MSGLETAIMRAMLTAALFIGALATAPSRAQSATLSVGPAIALGPHHCGEIWKKAPSQQSRGKLSVKLDLSDAGRDAFATECAARGGTYSPGRCPRSNTAFVCVSEASNASLYTVLYEGSADQDALAAQCGARKGFVGRRTFSALRQRPGRTIWSSCFVP
jgi:hypothetical protein